MILAVIPARGGSKRLPRKNIRLFAGSPLLVHTVLQARAVPSIGRVIVSTDDAETAAIAERTGAEVVMRPAALADDHATTASALKHVLEVACAGTGLPRGVVTLQPNCPLRPPPLIAQAIALFLAEAPDSVVSVTESKHKLGVIEGGYFRAQYRTGMRSQDMSAQYYENGVVYVSRPDLILEREDLFGEKMLPLLTDPLYALGDIDTATDFQVAELLFCAYRERFEPGAAPPREERA